MKRITAQFEGRFYPGEKKDIFSFISKNFDNSVPHSEKGRIILSPHAGYVFSGGVAAKAYSHLQNDFKTIIIIATAHTIYTSKCALIRNASFKNCIGEVITDDDVAGMLLEDENFEENPSAFLREHSVEVQIPFLQYMSDSFKIVPIVVNREDKNFLEKAARKIASIMKERQDICLVISSDLSHYPPYEIAYVSDNAMAFSYRAASINKDPDYFILTKELLEKKYKKNMETAACGYAPMLLGLLSACRLDLVFNISEYANSGDIKKDLSDEVVGYLGGYFSNRKNELWQFNLSDQEKAILLHIARKSVENYLNEKKPLSLSYIQYPALNMPAAVFVTITFEGMLRGCIGSLHPHMLMADAVAEYAVRSAFDDPRFDAVSKDELKKLKFEISILSPLLKIKDPSQIEEKKHGVYVKKGMRSGTYLPQVWEHFDNKEDFLRSLFDEKSGIGYNHITDPDTEIYVYTVEKITED